jgi:type I restriction enzyme M protein
VYAIDFDPRSIKIAKALNLIAGDGKTNVYRANTLDPRTWPDEVKVNLRARLMRFPNNPDKDTWNQENFRYFAFDVLLTNPPFAGDIKDSRILSQFDLAKKPNGKWQHKVGRDVLFIQRDLEFLRPGGRMAIVLPQGRLNNVSDKYIRDFVAEQARVLASVSLHINTFKPHTNTKTSILFLQKWNDDPKAGPLCKRLGDYPIFFATSQTGGKDNRGDYVYLADDNANCLYDLYGHPMVAHDLFNLRRYLADQVEQQLNATTDKAKKEMLRALYKDKLKFVPDRPGIAEAFQEWGHKQGFAFCNQGAE